MEKFQKNKPGTGGVWNNDSTNPQAPVIKGHFFAHRDIKAGEKVEVALFNNDSQNPQAPVYKVKVQDPWVKGEARQERVQEAYRATEKVYSKPPSQTLDDDFADDIPF